jgi:hypothetical protein
MKRLTQRHAPSGSTLLELIAVMCIMLLIIGIGFGSFKFLDQEEPFQEATQSLAQMSKFALNTAITQNRGMKIGFEKQSFGVVGASLEGMSQFSLPANMKMFIKRWGGKGWEKAEGQTWIFGENGICEPLRFRFEIKDVDSSEVEFHPLTGAVVQ